VGGPVNSNNNQAKQHGQQQSWSARRGDQGMRSHQVHQGQTLMVPDAFQKACIISVFNQAGATSVTGEFNNPK